MSKIIDIHLLDTFKDEYLALLLERAEWLIVKEEDKEYDEDGMEIVDEEHSLYLSYDDSLVQSIEEEIKKLDLCVELFFKAKVNNDELAMLAALQDISTFLSGTYGVFDGVAADVGRFFTLPHLIDFPEDYAIPECYNYPLD